MRTILDLPEGSFNCGAEGRYKRLSIVGRRVDALALGADERRDKLHLLEANNIDI